ncbi:MAG: hypothetical protein CYPHOPRED_001602 [Cyphobasidiales sp. Tagirdzhanova-0007]|nr:MAG: hypothetical protein CYPHOPRED_001602 [Cyphobasidiales sp. Tagirdzhanova-0007]
MSSKEELEEFEYQAGCFELETINQSLSTDPDNADLKALQAELSDLVNLTKEFLGQQHRPAAGSSSSRPSTSAASTSSTAAASFNAGTEVLAKWHGDGKFYPARIAGVSGSNADPVYTVIFQVDKSTEVVRKGDVKALSESKKRVYAQTEERVRESAGESDSKKLKKTDKKAVKEEERKARVAEQNTKQSSWQSFAKKGSKKGISIPGINGDSQFRSPDNPNGRVGVVGSGKGMTTFEQKKRAKWEEE